MEQQIHSGRTLERFSQFRLRKSLFVYLCWYMQVKMRAQKEALSVIISKIPSCSSKKEKIKKKEA